eukprot:TRINITY_DN10001_c0_g1_i1.p1 TRINITY_DN10001_c0_g1~~TRINITY_DN10001_c0_g1_i1.p1  ORF type:complete len:600 (+),score=123.18 TRINITY_DN10001_c0_g1_i1:74-1873(+)
MTSSAVSVDLHGGAVVRGTHKPTHKHAHIPANDGDAAATNPIESAYRTPALPQSPTDATEGVHFVLPQEIVRIVDSDPTIDSFEIVLAGDEMTIHVKDASFNYAVQKAAVTLSLYQHLPPGSSHSESPCFVELARLKDYVARDKSTEALIAPQRRQPNRPETSNAPSTIDRIAAEGFISNPQKLHDQSLEQILIHIIATSTLRKSQDLYHYISQHKDKAQFGSVLAKIAYNADSCPSLREEFLPHVNLEWECYSETGRSAASGYLISANEKAQKKEARKRGIETTTIPSDSATMIRPNTTSLSPQSTSSTTLSETQQKAAKATRKRRVSASTAANGPEPQAEPQKTEPQKTDPQTQIISKRTNPSSTARTSRVGNTSNPEKGIDLASKTQNAPHDKEAKITPEKGETATEEADVNLSRLNILSPLIINQPSKAVHKTKENHSDPQSRSSTSASKRARRSIAEEDEEATDLQSNIGSNSSSQATHPSITHPITSHDEYHSAREQFLVMYKDYEECCTRIKVVKGEFEELRNRMAAAHEQTEKDLVGAEIQRMYQLRKQGYQADVNEYLRIHSVLQETKAALQEYAKLHLHRSTEDSSSAS